MVWECRQVAEIETPFADGNVSGAVKIGDTVRRSTGPWTSAVHALLRYLASTGFSASPRLIGLDAAGRESLTFLPGQTAPATLDGFLGDSVLIAAASLLRRFHDAVSGFDPPKDARWRFTVGAPTEGTIVCHNDFAPWNVTFVDDEPTGLIDWDFAAPAPPVWDIAYALWRWVPLYPEERYGTPAERACRMRAFCDVYGYESGGNLVDLVLKRQRALYDTLESWGRAGVPGFAEMWRDGHGDMVRRDMAYLKRHRSEFQLTS